MSLCYTNRKGHQHYLRLVQTKKGGTRYYIVKNPERYADDELLLQMPSGFEFYEYPFDARVVLRKKLKSKITHDELSVVDQVMAQHETVKDYILDQDQESIFVYQAGLTLADAIFDEALFREIQSYDVKLRFRKTAEETYQAQRFCHISRYYGWITMETSPHLGDLAQKFCYHIDKESLLEFWIEGEEDW